MPFGLYNAPATFQKIMNKILGTSIEKYVMVYLNDIIIYSHTFEEHLKHLEKVLNRIRRVNFCLKAEKCYFGANKLQFLGHVVSEDGVKPDPEKVEKIRDYLVSRNMRELRGVLGLFSYYRHFIENFSKIAVPLNELLKKEVEYNWTNKQQQAFEFLKEKLITAPIVQYPDFEKPFYLYTDALTIGIGSVLAQKSEKREHVIAYTSRTLTPAEKNYGVSELECLAVV
jgi:hypothetical protein